MQEIERAVRGGGWAAGRVDIAAAAAGARHLPQRPRRRRRVRAQLSLV